MKHLTLIITLSLFTLHLSLPAAVPVRWTVETSRVQPATFDAYHGETLNFEAAFQSYGKPLAVTGPAALYYQTNGMGAAWWTAPATVASNTISAAFAPALDPGAPILNCFLGGTSSTYRAAFRLRYLNSPGATPNALQPPVRTLDLSDVTVLNAPWPSEGEYVRARGGYDNDSGDIELIAEMGVYRGAVLAAHGAPTRYLAYKPSAREGINASQGKIGVASLTPILGPFIDVFSTNFTAFSTIDDLEFHELRDAFDELNDNALKRGEVTAQDVGAYSATSGTAIENTVQAWQTYWDGDDVRVTVTNYYGSIDIPHLYIEQKMPSDDTHDAPWFKTIWDEMTRHQQILQRITEAESAIAEKADRAWGFYDSHTGEYSPDGYTQISSSNILIAAGMAYQKTITTDGEVWVLTATEPTTISGVTSNGFFRITDGDGNALFEIVKGDKRTVGATAGGITVDENFVHITYSVVSDDPPQIEMTQDLRNGNWSQLSAAVSWTGQSGAWVAHVEKPNLPRAFFRATYQLGAETYIKNSAPVGFERVYIGGRSYRVTVETVNGKKLMVLTDD